MLQGASVDSVACREAGNVVTVFTMHEFSATTSGLTAFWAIHSFSHSLSVSLLTLLITLFHKTVNTFRDLSPPCLLLPWAKPGVAGPAANQEPRSIDPGCCVAASILGAIFYCSFSSTTAGPLESLMERLKILWWLQGRQLIFARGRWGKFRQ